MWGAEKLRRILCQDKSTTHKNSVLTDEVFNDNSTKSYVDIAKNVMVDELSKNNGDLSVLEYVAGGSDNLVEQFIKETAF